MDPNLFHMDYERLFEVLLTIVIISFFIERALAIIFETRFFIKFYGDSGKGKGIKEFISILVSVLFCYIWEFDAITIIMASSEAMTGYGKILTGFIIAGGSKASIKLFKDTLGFMSNAEKERQKLKESST